MRNGGPLRGQSTVTWRGSEMQQCSELETEVKHYLQRVNEPQNLEEVSNGVSSPSSEVEEVLEKLVKDGYIVQKKLVINGETLNLYWHHGKAETNEASKSELLSATPLHPPSARSRLSFKSPVIKNSPDTTPLSSRKWSKLSRGSTDTESLSKEVHSLRERLKEVEEEIASFPEAYREDELQLHIEKLHEYNEMKDTGQVLIGKIAEVNGTTTAALYEEFGLQLDS